MLPGIYGDGSELTEFQSRLSNEIPIDVIELQSLEEPLAELLNVKAIGLAVAHDIQLRHPCGPLRLAGYSFGGSVAFEAARHLISCGRDVQFLGMIDVGLRLESDHDQPGKGFKRHFIQLISKIYANGHGGLRSLTYRSLRELLGRSCSTDRRLQYTLLMLRRFWPAREKFVRQMLLFHLRRQAMDRWQPAAIEGRVFLAISQQNAPSVPRWLMLCPHAHLVQLPGTHVQILQPPSLEILLSEFETAARSERSLAIADRPTHGADADF